MKSVYAYVVSVNGTYHSRYALQSDARLAMMEPIQRIDIKNTDYFELKRET